MPDRLIEQLIELQVRMSLETDETEALVLRVELADVELQLAYKLASPDNKEVEPLLKLAAQLATAQITADTAGQAIARDPSLAAQVAAVTLGEQAGDVSIGQAAGGNIINIHIGERSP